MNPHRLQPLLHWQEGRVRGAEQGLGQARQREGEQHSRLQALQRYAQDYRAAPLPASASLLANRAAFLGRLDQAVQAQDQFLAQARQKAEQARQDWLLRQREAERLAWLARRAQAQAEQLQQRREQQAMDERAAQRRPGLEPP